MEKELKRALQFFLNHTDWRSSLHDADCIDSYGHFDHPDDRVCKCDGPHNIGVIESVAKQAGLEMAGTDPLYTEEEQ